MVWAEVVQAKRENRKELVLSGKQISALIEDEGSIDPHVFALHSLNFLEISEAGLASIPDEIGKLSNLTSLIFRINKIATLPSTIGFLTKLKTLDLSGNDLCKLPEFFTRLASLISLNLSDNKIVELPKNFSDLEELHMVNLSSNNLTSIKPLCSDKLRHLNTIKAAKNDISVIPESISELPQLKLLDLDDNQIVEVPGELADCYKLKEVEMKGNKLRDRRFGKLVEQGKHKAILDYVRKNFSPKIGLSDVGANNGGGDKKSVKKKKGKKQAEVVDEISDLLEVLHVSDNTTQVKIMDAVLTIRPYIICCIVKNVNMERGTVFKRFIAAQTKLHDTVCEKRNAATIATHDLSLIQGNLVYDARVPAEIKVKPLFKSETVTTQELMKRLRKEADDYRKEHKRNNISGIHKYLDLLKNKDLYPCLVDSVGNVISFPPITNSESTKMTMKTKTLLLEVTSSSSMAVAKNVMEALLKRMTQIGMSDRQDKPSQGGIDKIFVNPAEEGKEDCPLEEAESGEKSGYLLVEQVKVVDEEGQMRVVFPSRADLNWDDVKVVRK